MWFVRRLSYSGTLRLNKGDESRLQPPCENNVPRCSALRICWFVFIAFSEDRYKLSAADFFDSHYSRKMWFFDPRQFRWKNIGFIVLWINILRRALRCIGWLYICSIYFLYGYSAYWKKNYTIIFGNRKNTVFPAEVINLLNDLKFTIDSTHGKLSTIPEAKVAETVTKICMSLQQLAWWTIIVLKFKEQIVQHVWLGFFLKALAACDCVFSDMKIHIRRISHRLWIQVFLFIFPI